MFISEARLCLEQTWSTRMNTEVQKLLEQIEEHYERRDVHALAQLHHPNAKYAKLTGGQAVGREALEEYFPTIFEALSDDIETETIYRQIEQVTPELAIIDLRIQHYRKQDEGREPLSIEGFTMIATREKGEWLVAATRGALVPHN